MAEAITEEQGIHKAWYDEAKAMTAENFPEFFRKLTEDFDHDYGTICHAVAAAAVGAANAVNRSPAGGITGFQASCIMWEFLRHWNHIDGPARLLQFDDMMYPQYARKFTSISSETWEWLQKKAKEKLAEHPDGNSVHPDVIAHWRTIAAGDVPFGLAVEAAA